MSEHTDTERDAELLAKLDADSLRLLFPERFSGPFEVGLLHPPFEGDAATRAAELAGERLSEGEPGIDGSPRVLARFELDAVEDLHAYYGLLQEVFGVDDVEVLLDGRRVPMVRELWLPLLWLLRS
jgi:hypothetical protein